jgi:alpha-ketoglutarate-dependent 2,4-dichlorophenoxyacetate dioxygenase
VRSDAQLRVRPDFADVSNPGTGDRIWGKESRKRMFEIVNCRWRTDCSFKRLPAKASLLYARTILPLGGQDCLLPTCVALTMR